MDKAMQNYTVAVADLLTAVAKELTAQQDDDATRELIEGIADGSVPVMLATRFEPFRVVLCHVLPDGSLGVDIFSANGKMN